MLSIVPPDPNGKTDPLDRVRELRAEVEALASSLGAIDVPTTPIEITDKGERVWLDDHRLLRIHVIEDCVFVSGHDGWEWWPNWTALRPEDARRIASALLAAAADVRPELRGLH